MDAGAPVRLGLVGAGLMGIEHLKAIALVPGLEVVAVVDADVERARLAARRFGIDRVEVETEAVVSAADVDAVLVAVPPAALSESVPLACARGKHVLCEKPLGVDKGQALALLAAASEAGIVHALCHQRRYDPVHRRVRDLVARGLVGVPRLVTVQVMTDFGQARPEPARAWTRRRGPGGGLLLQVLSHYIDLLRFTFGDFDTVFCDAATAPTGEGDPPPGDGDDIVVFAGYLPGGGRVSMTASWSLHHPPGVAWRIDGTDGTLEITPELRILGGGRGEEMRDLGLPASYLPAIGRELFSSYGHRGGFGWGDNTPMLASLAADFAGQVSGTSTAVPSYATFGDGLWVLDAIERGRNATRSADTKLTR